MSDTLSDATKKVRDKAADWGDTGAQKLDSAWASAGDAMESASRMADESAARMPRPAEKLARGAAAKLGTAAKYVREHDARDVLRDIEDLVKRYPVQSLVVGATVGFLVARSMRDSE